MRNVMAMLKTVMALKTSYEELIDRDPGVPGMMLVSGEAGSGKTTGVRWLAEETNGVMIRAMSVDRQLTLLTRIMDAVGQSLVSHRGNGVLIEAIAESLRRSKRTLFVDECDHLFSTPKLLETLRDIHDISDMPVVMIGHSGIERKMVHRKQLYSRISHWCEFLPLDLEDTGVMARTLSTVRLDEELLEYLHQQCNGNARLMMVAMSRIEQFAKANSKRVVSRAEWGKRKLFLNPHARIAA